MNNSILIFGANGWIGSKVCNLLKQKEIKFYKSKCRAKDLPGIEKELEEIGNITHIMSFIGRTHGIYEGKTIGTIDYLEKPGKLTENISDNFFAPLSLAILCKNKQIHYTYLGTGCIFTYNDYENEINGFTEESQPNFFGSSYSIVKGYTDQVMKMYDDTVFNVRIRMPITDEIHPRNFITKITNYTNICSISNSMSVLNDLLPIMVDLALKKTVGTINLTNPGLISHNEILQMYKEIVDPSFTWSNFSVEDQNKILASKRSNNYLDTTKLNFECNNNVKNIKESVREILIKMKQNKNKIEIIN